VTRTLLLAALTMASCATGYRSEEDSKKLRSDIDDRTIESHVRVALAADDATRGQPIEVSCLDGVVYLRGPLPAKSDAAEQAEALALGVEGVRRVVTRFASG